MFFRDGRKVGRFLWPGVAQQGEAERGDTIVITRRGKPVAVLAPYASQLSQERERAIERAVALMRKGLPIGNRRFTRDEMHER